VQPEYKDQQNNTDIVDEPSIIELEQLKPETKSIDLQTDFDQNNEESINISKDVTQLELVLPIENEIVKEYLPPIHMATQMSPKELKIVDLESINIAASKVKTCEFGTEPIKELLNDEKLENIQTELSKIQHEYQVELDKNKEFIAEYEKLNSEHIDVENRLNETEEAMEGLKKDADIGKIFIILTFHINTYFVIQ
jgi:hypothetical protein